MLQVGSFGTSSYCLAQLPVPIAFYDMLSYSLQGFSFPGALLGNFCSSLKASCMNCRAHIFHQIESVLLFKTSFLTL